MLRYNYKTPMGKMIIEQPVADKMKRFTILICEANCLAAFISIGKDENGKEIHSLYYFFADPQHARRIAKHEGKLLPDKVISIELNLAFKDAMPLLKILVKNGYKVKCYYKQIKED
jgi:hypothetical protein